MTPDYKVIGERIKKARIKKRYSQMQLAKKLEISTAFLSRIENGTAKANLNRLSQISNYLGVSLGYIVAGTVSRSKDYLSQEFNDVLSKCTPERKKAIFKMAKIIAEIE